jgi:hypothetical protein
MKEKEDLGKKKEIEIGKTGGEIGKHGGDVKPMPEKKEWEKEKEKPPTPA